MKHLYLFFILIFLNLLSKEVKSQYITIPDTNFRNYMQSLYPSCFSSSKQLDTVCAGNLAIPSLNLFLDTITTYTITDLTGIQYFKKVDSLVIEGNGLSLIPALPDSLTSLKLNGDSLSSLPPLPASLRYLDCSDNQLSSLPSLPPSLTYLGCIGNKLTDLPALPTTLIVLECDNNNLTTLPALPSSLNTLRCTRNIITTLPALSNSLIDIECSFNNINSLPDLPGTLTSLDCRYNNLYCMPSIPQSVQLLSTTGNHIACLYDIQQPFSGGDTIYPICNLSNNVNNCPYDTHHVSLSDANFAEYIQLYFPSCVNLAGMVDTTCSLIVNVTSLDVSNFDISNLSGIQYFKNLDTLNCSGNKLISLPPLPASLTYLDCSNNQLTSLPNLPGTTIISGRTSQATSLLTLDCQDNQIHCLPLLPDGLQTLAAMGNPIACVLNLPSSLTSVDSTYSICNSSNDTYGCIQQVTGTTNAMASTTIEVYPNPSTGIVTISCPSVATGIKVAGMDGQTVYQTIANSSSYTADLSNQGKGVYVVQIFSASGVATQKLVLE